MQGLTLTCEQKPDIQENYIAAMRLFPRPFLSIEPLLGSLAVDVGGFERVIVGAMTGPGAVRPKPEWVESIKMNVPPEKLFWKSSMREFL